MKTAVSPSPRPEGAVTGSTYSNSSTKPTYLPQAAYMCYIENITKVHLMLGTNSALPVNIRDHLGVKKVLAPRKTSRNRGLCFAHIKITTRTIRISSTLTVKKDVAKLRLKYTTTQMTPETDIYLEK